MSSTVEIRVGVDPADGEVWGTTIVKDQEVNQSIDINIQSTRYPGRYLYCKWASTNFQENLGKKRFFQYTQKQKSPRTPPVFTFSNKAKNKGTMDKRVTELHVGVFFLSQIF